MGEAGLATILRKSRLVELVAVIDHGAIEATLEREDFRVLILPASSGGEADHRRFLEIRPDICVLIIDLAGPETSVRFHDIDGETLARIINSLSDATAVPRATFAERIHWLRRDDLRLLANVREDKEMEGAAAEPYPDNQAHLADVKRWVAFSLLALLPSGDDGIEEAPLPGWTMNAAQARALLSDSILNVDPVSLWENIESRERASRATQPLLPLLRIADAFRLDESRTEKQLLWHVLGPELDGRFARVHGYLNDDLTKRRPTLTRLAQILQEGHDAWSLRRMLAGSRPFARHRLISVHTDHSHAMPAPEESVAPAPDIVQFLLDERVQAGNRIPDALLLPLTHAVGASQEIDPGAGVLIEELHRAMRRGGSSVFELEGGRESEVWFDRNIRAAGLAILKVDLALEPDLTPSRLPHAAIGWARRAVLNSALLLITGFDRCGTDAPECARICAAHLADLVPVLILHGVGIDAASAASGGPVRLITPGKLTIEARARLWLERARSSGLNLTPQAAEGLAAKARFDESQIEMSISIAKGFAQPEAVDHAVLIEDAIRRIARSSAPAAVQPLEAAFSWKDIVLPAAVFAQLQTIPDQVRHAGRVLEQWGYDQRMPYGRGVAALFSGPSGTGKSMAAQILAGELGSVLYRIDLSKTVSKWLGESEKILSQIFDRAQKNSAILFFDEADVLFAKRTEVRDAHDRYANVEVAYLLQRMEDYDGLAILTTNLKQNIDPAFLRRLRFVIEFPLPDAEQREKIWRLAFPERAKLAADVDFKFLARRLALTGGNIQQIAIRAAFAAAAGAPDDPHAPITMQHVVRATRQELSKLGMLKVEESLAQLTPETSVTWSKAHA